MSISTNYSYETQIPQNVMFKAEQPVTVVTSKAQPVKKDEKMSTAAKYMIGATALAGVVVAGIAARKGCFGEKIQKFFKTSSELKAEAEKKAKEKAEKEAKEKAERAAREARERAEQKPKEAQTTSSGSNARSANANATPGSSTKSSGGSNRGLSVKSNSTTQTSLRRNASGGSNKNPSSHTTNTTSTSETTQNITQNAKPAVKPQTSPELAEQLKVYEQLIPKLAEGGIKAEYFIKDGEIQAKFSVGENLCKKILAEIEENVNADKSMTNDMKEKVLKELEPIVRQDLQAIKTSGNPEIAINEFKDRLMKYVDSEMSESIQESMQESMQKLGEKFKYWKLSELLQNRTSPQREELAQAIYNAPMERYAERNAKSAKESAQVFEEFFSAKENAEKEAQKILKGIETSTAEAKEAQRKIDIAQASYNAPLERGLAHKSANESMAVFRKAGKNEYQVYYDSYEKVWKQAVKRKLTMKEVEKIMSEKIQEYVEKCGTFRKVNKDVVISGEPKKIVYEGIQYDITDKGELLKKVFVPAKGKNNAIVTKYENTSEEILDNILLQQRQLAYERRISESQRQEAFA